MTTKGPTCERVPQIRMVMLPKDTNSLGNIFGGVILSQIDLAAGEHVRRHVAAHAYVTKIMREVDFIAPVEVGDLVSYYAETVKVGNTSVTVKVTVESERGIGKRETVQVTSAEVVMVAIDKQGNPRTIK